jgi:hypothetical protein
MVKTKNNLTSFSEHLDKQYGKRGSKNEKLMKKDLKCLNKKQ